MTRRLRRAALFVALLPTLVAAEVEAQHLTRLARRGVPVADRAAHPACERATSRTTDRKA